MRYFRDCIITLKFESVKTSFCSSSCMSYPSLLSSVLHIFVDLIVSIKKCIVSRRFYYSFECRYVFPAHNAFLGDDDCSLDANK